MLQFLHFCCWFFWLSIQRVLVKLYIIHWFVIQFVRFYWGSERRWLPRDVQAWTGTLRPEHRKMYPRISSLSCISPSVISWLQLAAYCKDAGWPCSRTLTSAGIERAAMEARTHVRVLSKPSIRLLHVHAIQRRRVVLVPGWGLFLFSLECHGYPARMRPLHLEYRVASPGDQEQKRTGNVFVVKPLTRCNLWNCLFIKREEFTVPRTRPEESDPNCIGVLSIAFTLYCTLARTTGNEEGHLTQLSVKLRTLRKIKVYFYHYLTTLTVVPLSPIRPLNIPRCPCIPAGEQ